MYHQNRFFPKLHISIEAVEHSQQKLIFTVPNRKVYPRNMLGVLDKCICDLYV